MGIFDAAGGNAHNGEQDDPDYRWVQFRIRFSNGRVQDIREIEERLILSDFSQGYGDETGPEDQD
ncbi:MAG: hypothetical protein ACRD2X_22125 [Vicinamibacteraceae bacterium]